MMRTMFEMGFRNAFQPVLGQDSYDEGLPGVDVTPSAPTPTPAPTPTKPAGTSDSDWAKVIAAGITAAAAGYGAYTKEQIAALNAQTAKAAAAKSAFAPGGAGVGGVSANTLYLVGGLAVVGIIAAIALK